MNLLKLLFDKKINISDSSYKRFTKYYDYDSSIEKSDDFQKKIDKIYNLIINDKVTDIEYIAKESNCTLMECVLKINYLKNKRIIGDYYIDVNDKRLKACGKYEQELLKKYGNLIYVQHLQVNDIVLKMPGCTAGNIDMLRDKVYKEISHLYDMGLINGIVLNKVDYTIHYYTLDKKNDNLDLVTIKCPNCGANNDVHRYGKVRCSYCNTIIEDSVPLYVEEITGK